MSANKPQRVIFYGWWVLFACAFIQFYLGGTFVQGFSGLFNPIATDFGWSYTLISLAFTFRGLENSIMEPAIGFLVDRFGSRKLLFIGIVITGIGFWLFSRIQSLWNFYAVFAVLALGFGLVSDVVTMTVVLKWFRNKRPTLAIGLLKSGFGAGGLLMPAIIWLTDTVGWRGSLMIFAAGTLGVGLPLAALVKEPPKEGYLYTDGKASTPAGLDSKPKDMTVKEVLKTRNFWLLTTAILFAQIAGQALFVHEIPYLVSVGIPRQTAGYLAIVFSLSNVAGRLLFGWLGDTLDKKLCFVIGTALKTAGVFTFAMASTTGQFIPSMMALGLGFGGLIPLRPALQVEFFGMKAFATVQGLLMAFMTLGGMISPIFAGWMFDLRGSYRLAFVVFGAITVMAIPLILATRREVSRSAAS